MKKLITIAFTLSLICVMSVSSLAFSIPEKFWYINEDNNLILKTFETSTLAPDVKYAMEQFIKSPKKYIFKSGTTKDGSVYNHDRILIYFYYPIKSITDYSYNPDAANLIFKSIFPAQVPSIYVSVPYGFAYGCITFVGYAKGSDFFTFQLKNSYASTSSVSNLTNRSVDGIFSDFGFDNPNNLVLLDGLLPEFGGDWNQLGFEDDGGLFLPPECICTDKCTEETINPDCAVCEVDFSACIGVEPVLECTCTYQCTVYENDPSCPLCGVHIVNCTAPVKPTPPPKPPEFPAIPPSDGKYVVYDTGIWKTFIDYVSGVIGTTTNIGLNLLAAIMGIYVVLWIVKKFTK